MKKLISVLLSVVLTLSAFSSTAYAAANNNVGGGISPMYSSSDTLLSSLSFSGKTATCRSVLVLYANEKWISITQALEKQSSSGSWQTVTGASWSITSANGNTSYIFSNSKAVTASGKYRVKSVFVIESISGKRETVTVYSNAVSI